MTTNQMSSFPAHHTFNTVKDELTAAVDDHTSTPFTSDAMLGLTAVIAQR